MKAIIIGISGQDGQYLSALLEQQNVSVTGIDRAGLYHTVDLTDYEKVAAFISDIKPDYIFHLAANSTTRHDAWKQNHDTICTGSMNILEAVFRNSLTTRVFLSGSGLQFKNKGLPIKESDVFDATSLYAVSRIHSTYAARYYRSKGVQVYTGYFFNHDSPLRTERHINKLITNTVNRISEGSGELLEIGDLSVRKEFGFAGDIVKAIWKLVNQENIYETVIGTGKAYSIGEWIETCFALKGLDWKNHVIQKQGFSPEYNLLVSDPSTIFNLNWRPEVPMQKLAELMLGSK